jgi:protein-tyrosine phosphatase
MKACGHESEDSPTCPACPRVKGAGWLWESTDLGSRNPSGDNPAVHAAVDLHCHILPGLDDGARDLDDAVAMAQQAQADGIHAICATPHIRHDHDVRIAELPARIEALSAAVRAAGCRTRILPGGEVAVTVLDRLDDAELANVTLGGSGRWILLEPAPGPLEDGFERAAGSLRERGFRAVVAHPERHLSPDLVERLGRLVVSGALVQATAAFFTDEPVRPGMLALARAGLIHVLGSDSHSSRAGRPVALGAALDALQGVEPTASHLKWIARTAPEAIVRGEELAAPFPAQLS